MTREFFIALSISVSGIVVSAVFAGFENGMVSIRKARLDHAVSQGSWTAGLIQALLNRPSSMLAAVLLGTNLAHSFTAIAFNQAAEELFGSGYHVIIGANAVLTIVMLIFAEITPKVWFRQRPFHRCRLMIAPIYLFYVLTVPVTILITMLVAVLHRLFPRGTSSDAVLLRDDFRTMLHESETEGLLSGEGRRLLENSLGYHQQTVRDLMVPAEGVHALSTDATLAEALALAEKTNVNRFPVYSAGKSGTWSGVFSVYDAIYRIPREQWKKETILAYMRPLVTVSDEASASEIFKNSRLSRSPLLVVLDSRERQVGIVTAGDAIKPLFGQLD